MKKKLTTEGSQLYDSIVQLKFEATDGKKYATDCLDTQGLLRLIQSVPSPKAEPFKQWLAKVGYERMQEIADPEQSLDRARQNESFPDARICVKLTNYLVIARTRNEDAAIF